MALTDVSAGTRRRGRPPAAKGNGAEPPAEGSEPQPLGKDEELVSEELSGQKRIPGVERVVNRKLEKQALKVYALQTERRALLEAEVAERAKLTQMMMDGELTEYLIHSEGLVIDLAGELKAKVHKSKDAD